MSAVFTIKAGEPGPEVTTLAQWLAWRQAENDRMLDALAEQLAQHLADELAERMRLDAVMIDRDLVGAQQH